jgi:taurine dioxygenase
MSETVLRDRYRCFDLVPLSGAAGACLRGVDLSRPIGAELEEEIRRAFVAHSVLLFRDQDLSPAAQVAFTGVFGEVVRHPLYRSVEIPGHPEILVLEHRAGQFYNGRNDIWHSDLTFEACPALGSVLHCRACWEGFGDTMFANQYLAYEALSPRLKSLLDDLEAEHSASLLAERNNRESNNVRIPDTPTPVRHPVVRTHPDSGRKALYVSPAFTTGIVGLEAQESRALLAFLYEHATQPRFVYRHRWRVGDVVMFDNRCLMHYVVLDYPPEMHRRMHRTTAGGDRPR